jgi:hypothetical protein
MFKLFSVDDHIVEPPGVWVDRVPGVLKERVPHVVERDQPEDVNTATFAKFAAAMLDHDTYDLYGV